MRIAGIGIVASMLLATTAMAGQEPKGNDAPERAADPGSRMICKRFIETGSLVKGYRTCKTKREWQNERDDRRTPAVTGGACNSGGTGLCVPN
ncbi:hypothetical protein [Sphingomonas jatrophae]|uniref:Uncharacterized protein n=1 Tax=Sphingomonas jatrophae TaxID=1166337 RepID=A0A1I6KYP3_9SPHN|nr:hypothetical protein [Sphingomonas jatrophae]SFR96335.1 hypothetical protein SAMN05192580_1981 [Sphingomonas jatrophae]